MTNQSINNRFNNAEMADFKRFWVGDVGSKYLEMLKNTKEQLLNLAMSSTDNNQVARDVAIANGIDSVIRDVEATINSATENEKEEKAKK